MRPSQTRAPSKEPFGILLDGFNDFQLRPKVSKGKTAPNWEAHKRFIARKIHQDSLYMVLFTDEQNNDYATTRRLDLELSGFLDIFEE